MTGLIQTTTVASDKALFEAISNRLRGLSEKYKLSCFLSGLKDEIRLPVRMLDPLNLSAAYGLAKIQEEYVNNTKRNIKPGGLEFDKGNFSGYGRQIPFRKQGGTDHNFSRREEGANHFSQNSKTNLPVQRVSPSQMKERREKGLCYYCDDKWNPFHICKIPKLYSMQGPTGGETRGSLLWFHRRRRGHCGTRGSKNY